MSLRLRKNSQRVAWKLLAWPGRCWRESGRSNRSHEKMSDWIVELDPLIDRIQDTDVGDTRRAGGNGHGNVASSAAGNVDITFNLRFSEGSESNRLRQRTAVPACLH